MIASTPLEEIRHSLNWWLLRLRLRDAVVWGTRGLLGGLALALGVALAARVRPLFTVPELINVSAALAGGGLALFAAAAWLWPRDRLHAARFFDRAFGLKERTSTALEIAAGGLGAPARLAEQQLEDTLSAVRAVETLDGLPVRVARREWLALLALLAALAVSLALPNSLEASVGQQRAVQQAVKQTVQQIEAAREAIAADPALSQDQKDELTQPLEDALQRLQQGNLTREQAVAVLTDAEQKLQQLADPQSQEQIQSLQSAGEGLKNNASTEALGNNLANGDFQRAAQDLANLDTSNLSQSEQASLANELEQAANALKDTNADLAGQLQQAADALRQGDPQAAQQALQQAAQTLSQSSSQLSQAQAAAQAAGQVGQGRQAVARAGEAQRATSGDPGVSAPGDPGQQAQPGQASQQGQAGQGQAQGQQQGGQGVGQGQGSSQGQGQGQTSGGSGRGESNGEAQGGQAGQGSPE